MRRRGSLNLFAAVVLGQVVASGLLDPFGALGSHHHPLGPGRLAGIALVAADVLRVRTF